MENGRVTIYDVAERAGVSIATVSRAMSGGSISAKSRQKRCIISPPPRIRIRRGRRSAPARSRWSSVISTTRTARC